MTTPQQPTPLPVSDHTSDDSDSDDDLMAKAEALFKLIDDHLEGKGCQ
ncbi:hypothetical protein [Streptomyces litchfieldiae]|uniref:Uncharacterized protein n=1 Tax=Streptomyces litchfieldiae TaxID=3075543 RepID=A0ABU2N1X2_9ACTN|nr:hypothetical protein [Streptomyces sp. DSM 44938]MDT0346749.1 hypothetical protein [Streptomyces sp. DSM 44938]